jgi:hypothetical protein
MGYDERSRQDLEPEHALGRGASQLGREKRVLPALSEPRRDDVQHLDEVGSRPAAGIEHRDSRVGESVRDVQLFTEHRVHPGHHVLHDLGGRVPYSELLAERRVECLQEGLVEVLDGMLLPEAPEEGPAFHPIQRVFRPVQWVDQAESVETVRIGDLVKQSANGRHAERPPCFLS